MMILKMTNKDDNFYSYMGRFFGSRIVQNETKDRIYDDNNKIWYINLDSSDKPCAFISLCDNVVKNIYCINDSSLQELLIEVQKDILIAPSIVTNIYEDIYRNCGLKVSLHDNYKHFITIRGEK